MDYDRIDFHVLTQYIREQFSNVIYSSSGIGHCFCTRNSHISNHGAAQNHGWREGRGTLSTLTFHSQDLENPFWTGERQDNLSPLLPGLVQASDKWRIPDQSRAWTEGCQRRLRNRSSRHSGRRHRYPQRRKCRKIRLQDGETTCCLYLYLQRWNRSFISNCKTHLGLTSLA